MKQACKSKDIHRQNHPQSPRFRRHSVYY